MNKDRLKSVYEEPMVNENPFGELFRPKTPMEILKPVLEKQAPFELDPFPGLRASTGHPKTDGLEDVPSDGTM